MKLRYPNSENKSSSDSRLREVRGKIAANMVGRLVELRVDAKKISQGIVTTVFTEAGMPKLVVGGMKYDLSQILTVTPLFNL